MNKKIIALVYMISALAFSSAWAGLFSFGGEETFTRTTVTSGAGVYQIYPSMCTRAVLNAGRTQKSLMMIPRPVTYSTAAPIVKGLAKSQPSSSTVMRNYYGNMRVELNKAPGAGNGLRFRLVSNCLSQLKGKTTVADVTIGGSSKTFNQSSEYTCQDQAFPSPVTLDYTSTSSLASSTAWICFDTYKAIDPCPNGTATTETITTCTKE